MDGQATHVVAQQRRVYRHHPAQPVSARQSPEHRQAENLHWRPQQQAALTRTVPRQTENLHWQPQRQPAHTPTSRQPRFASRRKPRGRARWWRGLLLLALIVPGMLWLYAQAPRLFPFAARHGAHPGLLLLVVVALVVVGGLKQVVSFKTMQRVAPTLSEFSEE